MQKIQILKFTDDVYQNLILKVTQPNWHATGNTCQVKFLQSEF